MKNHFVVKKKSHRGNTMKTALLKMLALGLLLLDERGHRRTAGAARGPGVLIRATNARADGLSAPSTAVCPSLAE
jgi:hypothetical protein